MRLPGTRYQEHGWEHVRKLLGRCSLAAFAGMDLSALPDAARRADALDSYLEAMAAELRLPRHHAHAAMAGNSYGDTAGELAGALLFELRAQPSCWDGLCAAVAADHARHGAFWHGPSAGAILRKKANDMYAALRDKADADACQAASGRPCSPNRMYTYRMLDMAYSEIARLFSNWRHCAAQVAAILGCAPDAVTGLPVAARQLHSIAGCRAEWVINWSATLERHSGAPGPLHTKSKRFASLKNHPAAIAAMLEEIGGYEALSANMDALGQVHSDEEAAALWLEDYWRVLAQSEAREALAAAGEAGDIGALDGAAELLEAPEPDLVECLLAPLGAGLLHDSSDDDDEDDGAADADAGMAHHGALAQPGAVALSLSPCFMAEGLAGDGDAAAGGERGQGAAILGAILAGISLPVRLAVYHALLGPQDDSYPPEWLDPATAQLPALRQLAAQDGISMPTLRKRRNEAVALLRHAAASGGHGRMQDDE